MSINLRLPFRRFVRDTPLFLYGAWGVSRHDGAMDLALSQIYKGTIKMEKKDVSCQDGVSMSQKKETDSMCEMLLLKNL